MRAYEFGSIAAQNPLLWNSIFFLSAYFEGIFCAVALVFQSPWHPRTEAVVLMVTVVCHECIVLTWRPRRPISVLCASVAGLEVIVCDPWHFSHHNFCRILYKSGTVLPWGRVAVIESKQLLSSFTETKMPVNIPDCVYTFIRHCIASPHSCNEGLSQ